jgi:hypothetical protein
MTVLAVPVLVSLALGTSAVASPSHAGRAPAGVPANAAVTWHALALKNGWKSAQHHLPGETGNPSWAVQGGVVYLSGSIYQSRGSKNEFAVLPSAARPSHALYISVYTQGDTNGTIYIKPTGAMFAYGAHIRDRTELAGLSFPARSMAHHLLALRNGWNSAQLRWNTGDPSYAVRGGVVYLSGSLHQRVNGSSIFAVLPSAARPSHYLFITVYTYLGAAGILYIRPNGQIEAYSGQARSFTSLAGVSFPASTLASTTLTLLNGWQSSDSPYGTGDPSYAVHNGVVYLSGALNLPSGSNAMFAQLPHSAAPAHFLDMKIYTNNGNVGSIEVQPSGDLVISLDSSSEALFSSLATISYPLGS